MAAARSGGFVASAPQPPAIGGQPFGLGRADEGVENGLSRVWGGRGEGVMAMMLVGTRARIGRGGGSSLSGCGAKARRGDGGVAIRGFRRGASSTPGYWRAALRAAGAIATGSGGFVAGPPQPPAIGGQPFRLRVRSRPVPGVSSRTLLNPRLRKGSPSGCENRIAESQNRRIAESQNRRIAESQNRRIAESQNRRIAESQNRNS